MCHEQSSVTTAIATRNTTAANSDVIHSRDSDVTDLVGPRSVGLHLDALEARSVDLGGEGRAGREEGHVDAAAEVDELEYLGAASQQPLGARRRLAAAEHAEHTTSVTSAACTHELYSDL